MNNPCSEIILSTKLGEFCHLGRVAATNAQKLIADLERKLEVMRDSRRHGVMYDV